VEYDYDDLCVRAGVSFAALDELEPARVVDDVWRDLFRGVKRQAVRLLLRALQPPESVEMRSPRGTPALGAQSCALVGGRSRTISRCSPAAGRNARGPFWGDHRADDPSVRHDPLSQASSSRSVTRHAVLCRGELRAECPASELLLATAMEHAMRT